MAHIPLPENLLTRLRRTAQQDGLSLTRLFEKMLDKYIASRQRPEASITTDSSAPVVASSSVDPVDAEAEAFLQLHPSLLKNYPNQYVAVYQGKLIDHDADKLALFARIEQAYPNDFVLMRPVREHPEREFYFRSPRYIERV